MKSSKLSDYYRALRRERIMEKRGNTILQHDARRRSTVRYHTTRFDEHCGKRQRARYARQIAAGQIRLIPVTKPKAKRTRKTGST
jgi:hypothetical protein